MNVNLEVQSICTQHLRGIPYYTINLVEALVQRHKNSYSVSYYDYKNERNNKAFLEKYIDENVFSKLKLYECNTLSFMDIMKGNSSNDSSTYDYISYNDYFNMNVDVYHFTNAHNMPRNIIPSKTVVTVHDIIPVICDSSDKINDSAVCEFINSINYIKSQEDITIIADSKSAKDDMINYMGFSQERIHIVPLAYNKEIHYPEKNNVLLEGMRIDKPFILFLAALDIRKGVVDILDAFEQIKPKFPDLKLVLAGKLESTVTQITEKLKNYKYISDVILTGFVNDEQKRVLMSSAEVFLFPSEYEGFGLPVLEAMACGSPVITTNVSSLPEVGGDAALYVSPKNSEELADAMKKLLDSESLRKKYIKKGFEQIKKFSWEKTAELTEDVYSKIYMR